MTLPILLLAFAPSGGSPRGSMAAFLIQMVAIVGIFYFLLIRPQRQQQKRLQERISKLRKGDEVITAGGIIGEVVHLKDDRVTVRSGEARLVVERQRIAEVREAGQEAAKT